MARDSRAQIFKGYRLGRKLAQGNVMSVVDAQPAEGGPRVAIKFINTRAVPDGEELARATLDKARLIIDKMSAAHEIWPLLDAGMQRHWLYLIERRTELLTLTQALELHGPIETASCVERAHGMARLFSDMHANNALCCYLSPDNVLLHEDGTFFPGDFLSPAFVFSYHRQVRLYTPMISYLAPEVIRGEPADPRSDVFALAAVMYYAVTGRDPFPRSADNNPHWDIRGVPVDCTLFGQGCNSNFSQIIRWAMDANPDRRPPHPRKLITETRSTFHTQAILEDMDAAADSSMENPEEWVPPELADIVPVKKGPRSKRWLLPAVLVLAVLGAGFAYWWFVMREQQQAPPPAATACPGDMVRAPAGEYLIGDDEARSPGVPPRHKESLASFCIDKYEYPNKDGQAPRAGVTWEQADEMCRKNGRRLCTEKEWEAACAGQPGNMYPYGNKYSANICNTHSAKVTNSGWFKGCVSPVHATDLSGNLMEWTADWYERDRAHALRGGMWRTRSAAKCSARFDPAEVNAERIGFRCCMDLK